MAAPDAILFIPREKRPDETIHRGSNMMGMLSQKYSLVGLERQRGFGAGPLSLRGARMIWYWARVCAYGVRHRHSIRLIFCENTHAALGGILARILGKPCIWDMEGDDTLYLSAWRKSRVFGGSVLALHWVARKTTDLLVAACEEDRDAYIRRGYYHAERTVTLPLALDFSQFCHDDGRRKEELRRSLNIDPQKTVLIYTGHRTERPYREGAEWICRELAPRLESLSQDVQILLTGKGEAIPCTSPLVTFTGYVPNISDYIRAADIGLAPIWREAGVPGKVFEYMALGKPAVVTSDVRGLRHLTDGWDALVATTPADFIAKVISLVQHPERAAEIGGRAQETAWRYHSYEAVAPAVWRTVEETMEKYRRNRLNRRSDR